MPVWSSYATLGLTSDGQVGRLEVHWPDLPEAVVEEGAFLQKLAGRRVEDCPRWPVRAPEAVEAGIIHSPAIAFFMDIAAALRVVYRGDDPRVGRKPTVYLDRHGGPVIRPRDIDPARPDGASRSVPDKAAKPVEPR